MPRACTSRVRGPLSEVLLAIRNETTRHAQHFRKFDAMVGIERSMALQMGQRWCGSRDHLMHLICGREWWQRQISWTYVGVARL